MLDLCAASFVLVQINHSQKVAVGNSGTTGGIKKDGEIANVQIGHGLMLWTDAV